MGAWYLIGRIGEASLCSIELRELSRGGFYLIEGDYSNELD